MSTYIDIHGSDADVAQVEQGLRDYNIGVIGPSGELPVRIFLRDANGAVIGGLLGHYKWKWIYVSKLWVSDDHRGHGHGAALMRAVEDHARASECHGIYLDTFEYQARPFYEKLGFTLFGTLEGYPPGYRQFQLVKNLRSANEAPPSPAPARELMSDFTGEYARYKSLGERALAQMSDGDLNRVPSDDGNSATMIVYHMSGNLRSRFSNFLTTDGEKESRDRDAEFESRDCTRAEVLASWAEGWSVLEAALDSLVDADLIRRVMIRKQQLTVHSALCRSLAHVSTHVGQLVLLGRMSAGASWKSLSIPRGGSTAYNAHPSAEKFKR